MNFLFLSSICLLYSIYGIFFSLFITLLYFKYKQLRTIGGTLLFLISLCNLIRGITLSISSAYYLIEEKSINEFNVFFCNLLAFCMNFFDLLNLSTTVLISLFLYLSICKKIEVKYEYLKIGIIISVLFCLFMSLLIGFLKDLGYGASDKIQCWTNKDSTFLCFYIILCFALPLIIFFMFQTYLIMRDLNQNNSIFFLFPIILILTYVIPLIRRIIMFFSDNDFDVFIYIMYFFIPMQGVFDTIAYCYVNSFVRNKFKSILLCNFLNSKGKYDIDPEIDLSLSPLPI